MATPDEQFKRAVTAFKAGRKDKARDLLLDVVEKNERHEQAWFYLSALVDSLEDQQTCLENVLELNPNNEKARKALEKIRQKLAQRGPQGNSAPPFPPSELPSAPPFESLDWDAIPEPPLPNAPSRAPKPSTPPIGAEFATISGDSLVGGVPEPQESPTPFDGSGAAPDDALDWLSTPSMPPAESEPPSVPGVPAADPFASPTSVDWARDAGHVVHGSGQQVDELSPQEYDDWVRNLNLGNSASASPEPETLPTGTDAEQLSPFTPEGVAPFGGTEYMLEENDALAPDEPPSTETPSPFGVNIFEPESEPPPTDASAFVETGPALETVSDEVFEGGTPFVKEEAAPEFEGGNVFVDEEAFEPPGLASSAEELDFDFQSEPAALRAAARHATTRKKRAEADYFAQIPADIEPTPGITRRGVLLMAAIVVMIVLNGVSFALLF